MSAVARPRRPFVVTCALVAGCAPGCSDPDPEVNSNPPPIQCPSVAPADGDSCPTEGFWGNTCVYPCGYTTLSVECVSGKWQVPLASLCVSDGGSSDASTDAGDGAD